MALGFNFLIYYHSAVAVIVWVLFQSEPYLNYARKLLELLALVRLMYSGLETSNFEVR